MTEGPEGVRSAMPAAHREVAAHLRSVYEMSERWDLFAGSEDI
jgi:hypothetical protein